MAASSLAASKLRNIPNSLLYTLIRRNSLHPSAFAAIASNLIPSTPYLFPLQSGGVKSLVNSSPAYSPILQFRSSLMSIEAARTYGTKDDTDYVDYSGVEELDDIDDSYSDEEDIENYTEYTDDDESEDMDDK